MDPHFLALLTIIGKNKAAFNPSVAAIRDKYYAKYRGQGSSSSVTIELDDSDLDGN